MEKSFTLTPFFRHSVGFDRLSDIFDAVQRIDASSNTGYPPYNIEKHGETDYLVTMAVAGFKQEELDIVVHNERLIVSGKKNESQAESDVEYLHRGISTRNFERTFRLAEHMHVVEASLRDGLLTIQLQRQIPEEARPKAIPINGKVQTLIDDTANH